MTPETMNEMYLHIASPDARRAWLFVYAAGQYCDIECPFPTSVSLDNREALVMYLLQGSGEIQSGDSVTVATPGHLMIVTSGSKLMVRPNTSDPWTVLWVHLGGEPLPQYLDLLSVPDKVTFRLPNPFQGESLLRKLIAVVANSDAQITDVRAHSLLTRIMAEMLVAKYSEGASPPLPSSPFPEPIRQSVQYIQCNFMKQLKLEDVAGHASLSTYHFARSFKRVTGHSVMEYLTQFRLSQAKWLLCDTHLSVREIAERVGMPDQSYFTKIFKKFERATPTQYRQSHLDRLQQQKSSDED